MLKANTKSRDLEEGLARMILKDGLKPGDPILSENKLASLFGVSRVTVRSAIGKLADGGFLRSENGRGTFVAKIPEPADKREQGSKLLGFVCYGGIDSPYVASVARGVESGAETGGFHLCVGSVMGGIEREAEVIRGLLKRGVDGLIVSPVESNPASPFLHELARSGAKLVIVDVHIPGFDAPSVTCDDREGGFLATNVLLKAGHRRIAHIRGPELVENAMARFDGYRMALEHSGVSFKPELAPASDPHSGYNEEFGRIAMERLLELPEGERPTAIFAANDDLALGSWGVMKERGLSVPEDFSLVGYGNLRTPYERGLLLTSVDQRPQDIGRAAWEMLSRLLEGDSTVRAARTLLRPQLVERRSVADFKGR